MGCVQELPEPVRVAGCAAPGTEERDVEERQGALIRMGGEIGREPLPLRAGGAAAAGRRTLGVERHQMPRPDVEAVVALRRIARLRTEVLVVAGRVRVTRVAPGARARSAVRQVFMVPDARVRLRLHASPAQVVRPEHRRVARAVVLHVTERQDARDTGAREQVRRGQLATAVRHSDAAVELRIRGVAGDIAGRCDDRVAAGGGHDRRMRRGQWRGVRQRRKGQCE